MMAWFKKLRPGKAETPSTTQPAPAPAPAPTTQVSTAEVDIAPNDPLLAYILHSPGVIEVEKLNLNSSTLARLKTEGVRLAVPLVSQGELIGLLNLGSRLSEADYSTDDRRLLGQLATQAAPALRVAQLARQQQIEARQRERMEQELRVARVIQQTLLPKEVPNLPGWQIAAYWQPARAVSGDFYDFIYFPDGRLGVVVADVTDKGVPAALVMATTRSILRTTAERLVQPGAVLEHTNNLLCPDIPPNMFVTCLYALVDPASGYIRYANAGHNVPYQRKEDGVVELRARGMPLGLMPEMAYEEKETTLGPGENIFLYSDGLVEAHNPQGEMFGNPRLRSLITAPTCGSELISCLMGELASFTGAGWEQEDDVTFVTLEREPAGAWRTLDEFSLASQANNERQAMERVAGTVGPLGLAPKRLERLKTAVAEATMNAMEHGNRYREDQPVQISVLTDGTDVAVNILDYGKFQDLPVAAAPDLDAKLAGLQSPRGWGLFLIQNMVDEMRETDVDGRHNLELIMHLKGE